MIQKSLLTPGAKYDDEIEQLNIITPFLELLIKEMVYVEKSYGLEEQKSARYIQVYHLLKMLYDLKQVLNKQYLIFISYFINLRYKCLKQDYYVFGQENGIIITIFVDDFFLLGLYLTEISNLKKQLSDRFCIRDKEPISWYLDIEVIKDQPNRTLYINQLAFIQKILEDREREDYKLAKVAMDPRFELVKDIYQGQVYQAKEKQIQQYHSLVGSLIQLACMTYPDISFSVGKCNRYIFNPISTQDVALKKVV